MEDEAQILNGEVTAAAAMSRRGGSSQPDAGALPHDHSDTGSTESCGVRKPTKITSRSHGPRRPPGPKKGSWVEGNFA